MPTSITRLLKGMPVIAVAAFGLFSGTVRDARAAVLQGKGPVIKNLTAPSTPACDLTTPVSHQLSGKELKKLAAAARTAEDHLKLAQYYKTEANRLNAEAAAYETAAADYRKGPMVKNLIAPTAPANLEYSAKGFRQEAQSNRERAALHELMARNVAAPHQ